MFRFALSDDCDLRLLEEADAAELFALIDTNRAYLAQIITHRFGVSDIQAAFELFYRGETGKVVVVQ